MSRDVLRCVVVGIRIVGVVATRQVYAQRTPTHSGMSLNNSKAYVLYNVLYMATPLRGPRLRFIFFFRACDVSHATRSPASRRAHCPELTFPDFGGLSDKHAAGDNNDCGGGGGVQQKVCTCVLLLLCC